MAWGVDPELIAQTPPTSWEHPYFEVGILHDDLGNTLAWNVALGSMVKLHKVAEAEGDQPAVVDLTCPQADFTLLNDMSIATCGTDLRIPL